VNFKELNENMELPGGKIDADFAPNEESEVEFIWDTSGFSWKPSTPFNESDVSRHIEASIATDKKVAPVEVRHKPVVIVPGLWSKKEKLFRQEKSRLKRARHRKNRARNAGEGKRVARRFSRAFDGRFSSARLRRQFYARAIR
jgi:hypothetical protein